MRSTKIENTRTATQFAFGGYDGHKRDNVVAVVTKKAGAYLLTIAPGTKAAVTTEVRRDERILVDYDTSTVEVKVCTKDAEHGAKTAYPQGNVYCKPCHDQHLAASRTRVKARKITGDVRLTGEAAKAAASLAIAEAKVDRLMASLESRGMALWQVEGRERPVRAA